MSDAAGATGAAGAGGAAHQLRREFHQLEAKNVLGAQHAVMHESKSSRKAE